MNSKDVIIVKYLIEKRTEELNISKVSKDLRMDYKNVHLIIKRLEKESLVKLESFGQSRRVKLISQVHPLIFEAEYKRREELLKNKNLKVVLHEFKKALRTGYYVLLLFGSYAKRTQTKNSDMDLMCIVPDGQEVQSEKVMDRTARLLPLPVHCLVFSETQFLEMANAKDSNVGQEALNSNVILYGIEMYYEILP